MQPLAFPSRPLSCPAPLFRLGKHHELVHQYPIAQRQGARLLRHAMDAARSAGASTLLLEVRPSNEGALSLYRHFGFRQIGVRRGYYPAQGGREDALVLTHALEKAEA